MMPSRLWFIDMCKKDPGDFAMNDNPTTQQLLNATIKHYAGRQRGAKG